MCLSISPGGGSVSAESLYGELRVWVFVRGWHSFFLEEKKASGVAFDWTKERRGKLVVFFYRLLSGRREERFSFRSFVCTRVGRKERVYRRNRGVEVKQKRALSPPDLVRLSSISLQAESHVCSTPHRFFQLNRQPRLLLHPNTNETPNGLPLRPLLGCCGLVWSFQELFWNPRQGSDNKSSRLKQRHSCSVRP